MPAAIPDDKRLNYKIWGGAGTATALAVTCVAANCVVSPDGPAIAVGAALMSAGVALGWVVGVLVSPYDKHETQRFSEFSRAITAFLSGYLAAKLDKMVDAAFAPGNLADTLGVVRSLSAVTMFVVAVLMTYIFRTYAE